MKAALFFTKIPVVSVTAVDGGEPKIELSDDPYICTRLDVTNAPVLITLIRIGKCFLFDGEGALLQLVCLKVITALWTLRQRKKAAVEPV